ncbi:3-ketoacyl-reductase [Mycotypha africana]|uniref:3-ketoacyl-reductase n=1 Tax=Mycotypha africana TaxID=64632 RepID=UPI002301B919|nr:3-ketoacyl-reductase [Mycotypha africana]KAI8979747.1 3-ketoacyl-reductase [Mycotypha africana]
MSFLQKTAIITGATRGIGLDIAKNFASQGVKTILIGRDPDRVRHVEDRFRQTYKTEVHEGVVLDVSDKGQIESVLKPILARTQIDYLINAAGVSRDGLLIQLKDRDLQETINTNLLGTIRLTQHVSRSMIKNRKGGCIINIASVVGGVFGGNIGQTVYSASKAGIVGFTKSAAKELGAYQIRVNAIAPGFIDTDMTKSLLQDESKREKLLSSIPLKRFGTVEDVSLAALFIAQSMYMHGQVLTIDGGLTL